MRLATALATGGLWVLAACGGRDSTSPGQPPVSVVVSPKQDTLTVGTSTPFGAVVSGTGNTGVSWSLVEGATAGTVTSLGEYTAGSVPGIYHLVASSLADPASRDTARVQVVAAPSAIVTLPDSVLAGQAGLVASVPAGSGVSYAWTVTGGALTAGQGTSSIHFDAGGVGPITVQCTARNLADSAVTGSGTVAVVAGPGVTSFTAARETVTAGEGTTVTAVFANGVGAVSPGSGAVASGVPVPVGPFMTPYMAVTYTLTVTGFRGATATAHVSVVGVNPPVITLFEAVATRAPVGGRGQFLVGYHQDPAVHAEIQPGIGTLTSNLPQTAILSAAGPTLYTLTVTSPADSAVSDTATLIAVTPAVGQFTATASLHDARYNHATVLLADGRVLAVGGTGASGDLSSAELFDPVARTWTTTGSMATPRSQFAAVQLNDGRVIVGGATPASELYDPTTGVFTPGPDMKAVRSGDVAVLLHDGRALFVTGTARSAELFDPVADTFALTDSLPEARRDAGVITLNDGRVLVAGGIGTNNVPLATAMLYDPLSGTFSQTGSMATPHWQGAFSLLQDGRVLVAGGFADFIQTLATRGEIYDPVTDQWTDAGPLCLPRSSAVMAPRDDGTALLASGSDRFGAPTAYAEVYDPVAAEFIPVLGTVTRGQVVPKAVALPGAAVLIVGGFSITAPSDATDLFQ